MWRNLGSRFSSTLVQHLRRNLICAQAEQREEEATLWKKTETETETDQAKDDFSLHLLESQGLALYDLALAPNFWRTHIDGSLLVKIIFLKENRGPYQSYGILKTGRPIQLCQEADGGKSEIM